MNKERPSRLRFNFGFMLEATLGTSRVMELNYPIIQVAEDVTLSPLTGKFQATRTSEGVYISGKLCSDFKTECVRCLDEVIVPMTIELDELFYYPPHTAPIGANVIGENGFIDLSPLVRELSLLEVPTQSLCQPNCQGLCMECGANLNEGDCGCEEEDINPKMAVLKKILSE